MLANLFFYVHFGSCTQAHPETPITRVDITVASGSKVTLIEYHYFEADLSEVQNLPQNYENAHPY